MTVSTGIISTIAGTGTQSATYSGDNLPATSVTFSYYLSALDIDLSGNIYIADYSRIRKVTVSTGLITTIAGTDSTTYNGDGGAAISASLNPNGVAVDSSGF